MRPAERLPSEALPEIPDKRYFTIGEVAQLCDVKPHVLRYWEQEFPQLRPVKRRGNRRYYQQDDVQLIRTIRSLLYEQGFTITGARQRLREAQRRAEAEVQGLPPPPASRRAQIRDLRDELESLLKLLPEDR